MRLRHEHSDLLERLRRASEEVRRNIALSVCDYAVALTGVRSAPVIRALDSLRRGTILTAAEVAELEAVVASIDKRYLDLYGQYEDDPARNKDEYLAAYAGWCAASAVLFACRRDSLEAAAEAIYEALAAERAITGSEHRVRALITGA